MARLFQLLAQPPELTLHIGVRGSEFVQQKFGHGQRHFPFAAEDFGHAQFTQAAGLTQKGGIGQNADAGIDRAGDGRHFAGRNGRHHPFRLERLRRPQRYIGLDARRERAEALEAQLAAQADRCREAAQTEKTLKSAFDQYQNVLRGHALEQLAELWASRAALDAARADYAAQEQKLADCRENPMLQQLYREEEAREAAWETARKAVEQVGGDIRVCEKQIASCEAEQDKADAIILL